MITFNPVTKIIQLDSFTVSEKELWTAFVNWAVLSDNIKYWIWMTQLGWFEPIALYIYLDLWWKIRPVESDWISTITWNILVQGWGSPIVATIGNFQTLVNMETPVKAVAIESNNNSNASTSDIANAVDAKITESHGMGVYNRRGWGSTHTNEWDSRLKEIYNTIVDMKNNLPQNTNSMALGIKNIEDFVNSNITEKREKSELLNELSNIHKELRITQNQDNAEKKELNKYLSELFTNK